MYAWLAGERIPLHLDEGGEVAYVTVHALGCEVVISDGQGGLLAHASYGPDGREAQDLPSRWDHIDGVEVAAVDTAAGTLVVPRADVPVMWRLLSTSVDSSG